METQKIAPTISQEEQAELRKALKDNFPGKTPEELESMFQDLMDAGASHFYQKKVNGEVWYVGVSIDSPECSRHLLYYMTDPKLAQLDL